jgi:NAD(P)H dehydrogenase (quinone)
MAGQADMDQSVVAPPSSDLRTAEFLGRRVAEVAQELSAGRVTLGRPANRGVSGGADNQDPEGRGVMHPKTIKAPLTPSPHDQLPIQKETDHV